MTERQAITVKRVELDTSQPFGELMACQPTLARLVRLPIEDLQDCRDLLSEIVLLRRANGSEEDLQSAEDTLVEIVEQEFSSVRKVL